MLELQGYDYFWHATTGDSGPPYYAWFIKRRLAVEFPADRVRYTQEKTDFIVAVTKRAKEHYSRD